MSLLLFSTSRRIQGSKRKFKFFEPTHTIKTLGVTWNAFDDLFSFEVAHISDNISYRGTTKRQMLSDIAKTFDPLGWLSPVTMLLKNLMQTAWQTNAYWDHQCLLSLWQNEKSLH